MLSALLCPLLLLVLPGLDVLTEYLLVQDTTSALVPLHLRHQGADHLQAFRVLLPVVIACQVEPTEHLLPPVKRTVQVLDGSAQPEDDLVPPLALPFLGCPGGMLERMGLPIQAPKGSAVAISAEVVNASWPKAAHCCLTSCSGIHRVERLERSGKAAEAEQPEGRSSCCCGCDEKVVVMERRLLSVESGESQAMRCCAWSTRTAEPAPVPTH